MWSSERPIEDFWENLGFCDFILLEIGTSVITKTLTKTGIFKCTPDFEIKPLLELKFWDFTPSEIWILRLPDPPFQDPINKGNLMQF